MGRDRTVGEGDPRQCFGNRRDAQAGGIVLPPCDADQERAVSARFSLLAVSSS
jgi:hypothetical protein